METESNVTGTEKTSSIEVSQNAKGQYSFKVKKYFDDDFVSTINDVEHAFNILHEKFK